MKTGVSHSVRCTKYAWRLQPKVCVRVLFVLEVLVAYCKGNLRHM